MALTCPQCRRENDPESPACTGCGTPLVLYTLENRYHVHRIIKSGSMGCVYHAWDSRLKTPVALKKMLSTFATPEERQYAEERFRDEATLLSRLHHGGLPRVIDYFTAPDPDSPQAAHYLVMTFIEGKDLDTLIRERGGKPFPFDEARRLFAQVLEILEYLHRQDPPVIYRDIKPSNVMLREDKVFLVDFGIARLFIPQKKGTAIGTPGYAAPEQYKGQAEPRSDLYSLGALMHYLFTGLDPEGSAATLFTFEAPSKLNPAVPEYLSDLVLSMVDLVPQNRPSSAREVLAMLAGTFVQPAGPPPSALPAHLPLVTRQIAIARPGGGQKITTIIYKDIFDAVRRRDLEAVSEFLNRSIPVNIGDREGRTPLHIAAWYGQLAIAELLLSRGAALNKSDREGKTPLHMAAWYGHPDTAALLIEKGAKVNAEDSSGWTPLRLAAQNGLLEIVELLVSRGAKVNILDKEGLSPLYWALWTNHRETAEFLIGHGADVNWKNDEGRTYLHLAAQHNRCDMAEVLLSRHAEVNAADPLGTTPLHLAARGGFTVIAETLLLHGAAAAQGDGSAVTPLHVAAVWGHEDFAALLLKNGHEVNVRDDTGSTPLHRAAQNGRKKIAAILIAKGADIHGKDREGRTALHLAAACGTSDVAALLLLRGADFSIPDRMGITPLAAAEQEGHRNIMSLMLYSSLSLSDKEIPFNEKITSMIIKGQMKLTDFLSQPHMTEKYAALISRGKDRFMALLKKYLEKQPKEG
ncbi:MAG: ankyrin repeat domain-containing protein [Candidatus Eremiobacteraeota bacterium]|nr:ankyrin repeat domain-containing protein [Candidatus Eremiobacteraeota bacterium]